MTIDKSKINSGVEKKWFVLMMLTSWIFFSVFFGGITWFFVKPMPHNNGNNHHVLVKTAEASEIYPEFICSCCGRTLDPNNICCGDMKRKIDFIESQADAGLSKDEIIIAGIREFGINSLAKEETKQALKEKLIAMAPADSPKIIFSEETIDLGEVSQNKGEVFAYFDFINNGESDLIINNINTSCGCTSASVVYQGEEGPIFTMPGHGKENPENWSVAIAPGQTAQIKIYYDPNAHGPQEKNVLPITRTVSIFSNDPVEFEKQIRIELNQVP